MKKIISPIITLFVACMLYSCSAEKVCVRCARGCESATLFYLPDCREIKGYVNFDQTRLQRVFQHELPAAFRKDSMRVCLKYENIGPGILMSDCVQSEIIRIKSICPLKAK